MPDPAVPAAAILAEIRERQALASDASLGFSRMEERHDALIKVAYEDAPLLLAAVEAVLPLHQPIVRRKGWHPTCSFDNHRWPCAEYRAITTALTGAQLEET
jgi:hypothetical protein